MSISPSFLLLLFSFHFSSAASDYSEFLFANGKLCGDPFADPIWIPTLDMCTVECDPLIEYCVENEELQQMCKPLPDDCQTALKKYVAAKEKETTVPPKPIAPLPHPIVSPPTPSETVVIKGRGSRPRAPVISKGPVANLNTDSAPPTDLSNPPPGALGLFPLFNLGFQPQMNGPITQMSSPAQLPTQAIWRANMQQPMMEQIPQMAFFDSQRRPTQPSFIVSPPSPPMQFTNNELSRQRSFNSRQRIFHRLF